MPLRCLFLVQGEGRGHLTQALSLRRLLVDAGHSVTGVMVGQSPKRPVPGFFERSFEAPVRFIDSPSFVPDSDDCAVRPWRSVFHELGRMPTFLRSLERVDAAIEQQAPDVIVNFFEPLGGLYAWRYRPGIPIVAVAHQYMFDHPAYSLPAGRPVQRWGTQLFSRLTAWGADRRLALSLYPAPDRPHDGLTVCPPLLRPALFRHARSRAGRHEPFFLVYLLNSGYAEQVVRWHEHHPDVRLHCFWDRPDAAPTEAYDDTLTFHQLDDEKFLSLMARCRGFVSTAGFESVAEAMYLGVPVQVVPVDGHFEQHCNAADTVRAGAGVRSDRFDLDRLRDYLPHHSADPSRFRRWIHHAQSRFVRALETAAAPPNERARNRSPVIDASPELPRHASAP